MKKNIYFTFIIAVMLIGMISMVGCIPETLKPDLILENPEGWVGFCDIDDSGNLVVHVKNQGLGPAESSNVEVDFGDYGTSVKPVQALMYGDTATVLFPIPSGCFNPDCDFEITVDVYNEVDESNESNNSQSGWCIG
jgi:subtilase family serine protease